MKTPANPAIATTSSPLRVGLVATCLNTEHVRGMGKYLLEMSAQAGPEDAIDWTLFGQDNSQPMLRPRGQPVQTDVFDFRGDRFHLWEQIGLPLRARRHQLDVLHCTENSLCWWQPVPTVVTVHDTLPWENGDLNAVEHGYWHRLLPAAMRRCAHIITISECSRQDILARWPELERKLTVIPHGIDAQYFAPPTAALPPTLRQALAGAPYLVYMGGPMARKRFSWALEVLAATPNSAVKLVACGFGKAAREQASAALPPALAARVLFAEFLSDAELLALYQDARAVLYPTLYEGFGFPAVEAQAAGTPVIFSALGSLKELIGPLAKVVPADDLPAWVAGVNFALSLTDTARRELATQASAWAARFRWSESFSRHAAVYRQVGQRKKQG